jgi:hypothetical protein
MKEPMELTAAERKTLGLIVLASGEEPFTAEALEGSAQGRITGFEAELGIERLRERGIVVARKKSWGEIIHTMAPGLFTNWQQAFLPGIADCIVDDEQGVESLYEPKSGFLKQLLALLATAQHTGLTLTQKGTFHKKDLQRLQARIVLEEESLKGLNISYMHQDKLGKPMAILYDTALRLGLLRSGVSRVETVPSRLEEWLCQRLAAAERQLQTLWWEVYTPSDVWLQHGAAALRNVPEGRWLRLSKLASLLQTSGVPTGGRSGPEAEQALRAYWAEPMAAFGWLEFGTYRLHPNDPPETVVRKPAVTTDEEDGWYVQPDFEVIVPPTTPLRARWKLEACAEYAGGDTVDRYKITKESWERALAAGMEPEGLLESLKEFALYGVPDTVEASIKGWNASYGAMTLEDVTLLRCKHARDVAFLKNDASVSGFLTAQIGELDFIVSRSHIKLLLETLRRQGFSPRVAAEAQDSEAANDSRHPAGAGDTGGIIHSRRNASLFPIDPAPPGTERLRERLERVPQAWLRSFRKYHASTVKELMETAIDVRTSVKLTVDGESVEIVPKRLQPLGSDWIVEGYVNGERASIASEACGEAQLLLPEQA